MSDVKTQTVYTVIEKTDLATLQARCDRYKAALESIAAMDYDVDGLPEHNEWAEAVCFNKAQEISRKALEDTK